MASTPFIKPIPNSKGILYTMQSALNDMTTVFSQDNKRFRMSKYALINIPSFEVPNADGDNATQLNAVGDDFIYNKTSIYGSNMVKYMAESFQNYCLNFEAMLLSQPGYDVSQTRTVSERVFWKWLKESGAVRFRKANSLEQDLNAIPDPIVRFVEEDEIIGMGYAYNRVVKYIADIEVVNTVQNSNTYTEFYIYIPTQVGSTPYVLFDSISDKNYRLAGPYKQSFENDLQYPINYSYGNVTAGALDEAYLVGRHYDDSHPFLLDIHAAYDYSHDDSLVSWQITDPTVAPVPVGSTSSDNYWFVDPSLNAYSYYTDTMVDYNGTNVGDCRNRKVTRQRINTTPTPSAVSMIRSNLDGITIDFDKTHYKVITENPALKTLADFNETNGSLDFSYNAILLYYEQYDPTNPSAPVVTNLFGVQFLSKPVQSGTYWRLPAIDKAKPDVFHKVNGNSFAHKVNLKFDTSIEGAAQEKSVNDFGTFSLDLYIDALTAMRNMAQISSDNMAYLTNVVDETRAMKELMINDVNSKEILLRLGNVENSLIANSAMFQNTNSIMQMIEQVYDMYNNIIQNNTDIRVNYNFDPMVLNNMVVLNQQYNLKVDLVDNIGSIISLSGPKVLSLAKYTNYYKHQVLSGVPAVPVDIELTDFASVNINDSTNSWETGQSFDISFETRINPGAFGLLLYTDALNKSGNGIYGCNIALMNSSYFNEANDYSPIIRITCINKSTMQFTVDKIR